MSSLIFKPDDLKKKTLSQDGPDETGPHDSESEDDTSGSSTISSSTTAMSEISASSLSSKDSAISRLCSQLWDCRLYDASSKSPGFKFKPQKSPGPKIVPSYAA